METVEMLRCNPQDPAMLKRRAEVFLEQHRRHTLPYVEHIGDLGLRLKMLPEVFCPNFGPST
ncbi:MAG: hypothetical protein WCL39_11140, partial [Armatimonadota bacterium]